MQTDYKKSILNTVLLTLLVLMVSLCIVVMLMFFVFTKDFANFMYNIGCDNIASDLYYRSYTKTNDIVSCYKALNIKISLGDNEDIIMYYEAFVADDEYENFMSSSKQNSENLKVGKLEKSTLLNDKNYLDNNYVIALASEGRNDDAWEFALGEFALYDNFTFKNQGVYSLSLWVKAQDWSVFNKTYDGFDKVLVEEIQDYFDRIYLLFEENKNSDNIIDQAYLIALGNRIITVGQDVNRIKSGLGLDNDKITANMNKMVAVNNVIKGLV